MWPSIWEWSGYRLQTHQGFCCGSVTIISFFIMHLLTGNCAFLQLPLSKTFPSVFFMFFLSLPSRKYKLRSTKKKVTWSMACEEKPDRSCDLTEFDLHYLGIYVLRVRANLNGNHSDWVQKEFCPDKEGELERERGEDEMKTGGADGGVCFTTNHQDRMTEESWTTEQTTTKWSRRSCEKNNTGIMMTFACVLSCAVLNCQNHRVEFHDQGNVEVNSQKVWWFLDKRSAAHITWLRSLR